MKLAASRKRPSPRRPPPQANPTEKFTGKLTFVYPHVDQETRTLMVRFELPNPGHKLRPGTTATVKLKVWPKALGDIFQCLGRELGQGQRARIAGAVGFRAAARRRLHSLCGRFVCRAFRGPRAGRARKRGHRHRRLKLVYRETLPGEFEGVHGGVGPAHGRSGRVTTIPCCAAGGGDRIVTAGSFLLDAETRLNPAAGSIYFGGSSGAAEPGRRQSNVRPSTPKDADAKIKTALASCQAGPAPGRGPAVLSRPQDNRLGLMGTPVRIVVGEQPVFCVVRTVARRPLPTPRRPWPRWRS